jgi:signal transduction histidine kinase
MRIRIKSIIALVVTTICLLVILHFISNSVIQTNFLKIEQDEVTQTIGRIQVAVTNRYAEIDSDLVSCSQLNSTYAFIQNQTRDYRDTYLTVSSLANMDVNFVLFLNEQGTFVTGMGLNLTTMQQIPIPQDIISKVTSDSLIWNLRSLDSHTNGFILSEGQPLLLASRPILMTDGRGPARGVLIFARYYDAAELQKLSYIMKVSYMSIDLVEDWQQQNAVPDEALSASYIKPLNDQFIAGYDIIDDIRGQPVIVIGATMPRIIYNQGLATIGYMDQALTIVGIVFSVLIIILLEFSVLRRLSNLTGSVTKLGQRESFSQRLSVSGNDEVTWLTLSINGLLEEIQTQSLKLQKTERLSAIGEFARQIGHDLRNPLTSTKYAAYYLKQKGDKCSAEDRDKMLDIITTDVNRSDKIITDLIEYSSEICVEPQEVSPKSLVTGALLTVQVPNSVTVVDKVLAEPKLWVDEKSIQRVFSAIVQNSVDAMPNGGALTITSHQGASKVTFSFTDTGVGISEELLPKLFSPLLTTKARGMGFSLAISKRIIESHGGEISVESATNKGTTFRVTLPIQSTIQQPRQTDLLFKKDPLLHYKPKQDSGDFTQS